MSHAKLSKWMLFGTLLVLASLVVGCGGGDDGGADGTTIGLTGGTVALDGGPSIDIPPGAVSSGAGDISLAISKSNQTPSLPQGLKPVGDVWEVGPSGTTFVTPVRITLPIPKGADPGDVVGVITLDQNTGEWVSVSSSVDAAAGTVSAFIDHLSPFGIICGRAEAAKTGGWIRVVNPYGRGSQSFPGGRNLPMHKENLVCFTAYGPTNPSLLVRPSWDVVVATPYWGETAGARPTVVEFWLPAGNYTLEQSIFASEINNSPTYSPEVLWWTRTPQNVVLAPGMTLTFEDFPAVPPDASTGFVQRPNTCALASSPLAKSKVTPTVSPSIPPTVTPEVTPSPTAVATAAPAKLPAAWTFVCGGNAIPHQLDTLVKNPDGTFRGTGHVPEEPSFTWDLSGSISGSTVTWTITYTGSEAGFVYGGTGTIAADGSLQSNVSANVNNCTQVTTGAEIFP